MKVALVILHADPARGGAERYTIDLANALSKRGHDVTLLASSFARLDSPVKCVPITPRGFTRTGKYKSFLRRLEAHLRSRAYDVVHAMLPVRHCDLYHPHAGVAAAQLEKWNSLVNPRRRAMARFEKSLVNDPNGPLVLCLSEYVKRFVREHYPLPDDRLPKLFNAVNLDYFVPEPTAARSSDWVNALIIAQDYERKGLREAIQATAKVADERLRLIVVGKEDPADYASLAKELGIGDRVVFHPPTAAPRDFYRQADFFVLPTKHDPCSLVVLEALAMGLPVISTVFNGATEIMTSGTHGFVLSDPLDVSSITTAMTQLCNDVRRREMSRACLALRPRLAYEHHLDELLASYERVVSRRRSHR